MVNAKNKQKQKKSQTMTLKSVKSLLSKVASAKTTKSVKSGKKSRSNGPRGGALSGYARMLQDPCSAPLGPGLYGTGNGYALRFHNTLSADAAASVNTNCGFVLYCPNYHCEGGSVAVGGTTSSVNLLIGAAGQTNSLIPINGVTGGATTLPLSYSPPDPAYNFMASGTPQDARCVGACVRVGFEQNMTQLQGRVAYLDLPQNIIDESFATGFTVDQLFALSRKVERVNLGQREIRWKPGVDDHTFRAAAPKVAVSYDDPTYRYNAGLFSLSNGKYETTENRWIGFAFLGIVTSTVSQVRYDIYKNIEWRPKQGLGMALPNEGREASVPPVRQVESLLPDGWQVGDVADMGYRAIKGVANMVSEFAWLPNATTRYPSIMG